MSDDEHIKLLQGHVARLQNELTDMTETHHCEQVRHGETCMQLKVTENALAASQKECAELRRLIAKLWQSTGNHQIDQELATRIDAAMKGE